MVSLFDCAQLASVDSSALSSLVQVCRSIPCHLCRMPGNIQRLIHQIGLDSHIPLHDDLTSAMNAMLKHSLTKQVGEHPHFAQPTTRLALSGSVQRTAKQQVKPP